VKNLLKITNLHKEYPGGDLALRGVNLELKKGEITAVIGQSGAGKYTLIRCINRLVEATEGKIILHDKDINKLNKKTMDIKQLYREETELDVYTVELMEQRVEYFSDDYVKWLEAKINYTRWYKMRCITELNK
jgi:ABC-type methionine transport system ATPase subunit